ncbi:MAG TPA: hypothetical protein VFQ61_25890, partial [Polyangiaceae bacterium]|nr:hypothetical protein [Polyangiaceae bacterium]
SAGLIPLLGLRALLWVALSLLLVCAGLYWAVERRQRALGVAPRTNAQAPASPAARAPNESPTKPSGAFALVMRDRYLSLIAAFSLIFTWVNTNGEYMLGKVIRQHAVDAVAQGRAHSVGEQIGASYAQFFFYVNVIGVLLQTFVVARLVRWLGFRTAFLVLPVLALGDASAIALAPVLLVICVAKGLENSTDYSLNNTLRQMLWLVTSREMKYKAKQAVDTFFVRMGDVCSALLVWIGVTYFALDVRRMATLNLLFALVWLFLAVVIGREHARRARAVALSGTPSTTGQ